MANSTNTFKCKLDTYWPASAILLRLCLRRGSVKEGGKCGICDRAVGEKDQGVQCELCEKWFHAGCVKIPNEVYKVLGQITNLHWFCEVCNSSIHKVMVAEGKMQE